LKTPPDKTPSDKEQDVLAMATQVSERLEQMRMENDAAMEGIAKSLQASDNLAQLIGFAAISLSFLGWGAAFLMMALGVNLWVSFAVFTGVGLAGLFLSIKPVRNRLAAALLKIRRRT